MCASRVDLGREAFADRAEKLMRGLAHRHQRVDLVRQMTAIAVDRLRGRGDRLFEPGGLRLHRARRDPEPRRLGPARPHREQPDDADQRRHDAQRCEELDQRDRSDRTDLAADEPEHDGEPEQDRGDRRTREDPPAIGAVVVRRQDIVVDKHGCAFLQRRWWDVAKVRIPGRVRAQADDGRTPVHVRVLP